MKDCDFRCAKRSKRHRRRVSPHIHQPVKPLYHLSTAVVAMHPYGFNLEGSCGSWLADNISHASAISHTLTRVPEVNLFLTAGQTSFHRLI